MAIGTRSDGILLKCAAANAVVDGGWQQVDRDIGGNSAAQDVIVISLPTPGATPTIVVEGRNDAGDTPVQLSSGGVAAVVYSQQFRQYRARLTVGTGTTAQVSINRQLLSTT